MNTNTNNTAATSGKLDFEQVKRNYENALASGKDSGKELTALATAVAYSVLNKCIDPQRKTAVNRDTVSNNGYNPALVQIKQGIFFDGQLLDNTAAAADKATHTTYNADGDTVTEVVDKTSAAALDKLIQEALSDGIDIVQTAALAILEQAQDHAAAPNWLDTPYTVNRLSKRVYIKLTDSAAYRQEDTTPIQEVYRSVRTAVQNSRAVQTDPRNGFCYIDAQTADGLDTIYYRLGKYADMGGYDCNGNYTADEQTAVDYDTLVERLELTDRQAQVLKLRMQGKGYKAIATYLGVTQRAIAKTVEQVQKKAVAIGLTPNTDN